MNTFRYVGLDSLDEVCSHVFHADQTESAVQKLMESDPEAFHYMIMGNDYEYMSYIEYYVSPYLVDVLTTEIGSATAQMEFDSIHVEAKKVNFCYDQIKRLGVDIIHPARPESRKCTDYERCSVCPGATEDHEDDGSVCDIMCKNDNC